MPQLIGGLIVLAIALEILRWVVQWIWACVTWFWDVLLMPFFIYFTPAVLIILVLAAIYWGAWIASQNYFLSLKANIVSDGLAGTLTRKYIISVLTLFLVSMYLSLAIPSALFIYQYEKEFVFHVDSYYQAIKFPAFIIRPLFGSYQAESLPTKKTTLEKIDITLRNDNCWNQDFYVNNNIVANISAHSSINFRISPATYTVKACTQGISNCGASTNVVWTKPTTYTISQHPDCFGRYSNKQKTRMRR